MGLSVLHADSRNLFDGAPELMMGVHLGLDESSPDRSESSDDDGIDFYVVLGGCVAIQLDPKLPKALGDLSQTEWVRADLTYDRPRHMVLQWLENYRPDVSLRPL